MQGLLLLAGLLRRSRYNVALSTLSRGRRLREIEKILAAQDGLEAFINYMLGLLRTLALAYHHRLLLAYACLASRLGQEMVALVRPEVLLRGVGSGQSLHGP